VEGHTDFIAPPMQGSQQVGICAMRDAAAEEVPPVGDGGRGALGKVEVVERDWADVRRGRRRVRERVRESIVICG